MQNRYTGDVGDFGKLALLRALSPGKRLGVCWYMCSGAGEKNLDGKHLDYLDDLERFRHLDEVLFDALVELVAGFRAGGTRSVKALQDRQVLDSAVFHDTEVPDRPADREAWFAAMKSAMQGCDLVFVDPDNGLEGARATPKHVRLREVAQLLQLGSALLVYHHQSRQKGGAAAESRRLHEQFQSAGASRIEIVRLRPYSPRFYALLNGDSELSQRLHAFAREWEGLAELCTS